MFADLRGNPAGAQAGALGGEAAGSLFDKAAEIGARTDGSMAGTSREVLAWPSSPQPADSNSRSPPRSRSPTSGTP